MVIGKQELLFEFFNFVTYACDNAMKDVVSV